MYALGADRRLSVLALNIRKMGEQRISHLDSCALRRPSGSHHPRAANLALLLASSLVAALQNALAVLAQLQLRDLDLDSE